VNCVTNANVSINCVVVCVIRGCINAANVGVWAALYSPQHNEVYEINALYAEMFSFHFSWSLGWLGSRVVSVLDSGTEGPGFKSQSQHCRVTVLGKLFTPIMPLFTKQRNW